MNFLVNLAARMLHISPRVIRFLISGGTVAATELAVLYVLTSIVGLWYEFSLVLAFIVAFCVSFSLQKFWTFEDKSIENIYMQAPSYLAVSLSNLAVNAVALYALVQYAHLWYLFAQFIISAVIAVFSFLIYKFIIFKKRPPAPTEILR